MHWLEWMSSIIVNGTRYLGRDGSFCISFGYYSVAAFYHFIHAAYSIKIIKQLFAMHDLLCSVAD